MSKAIDVLGLGCVAVDELLYIPEFPTPEVKLRVRHHERQGGGLTGTALVAAARLGSRCAYAGTLGDDELSKFLLSRFHDEGIDTSWLRLQLNVRPIHSFILVDEQLHTRTVIFNLEGTLGAQTDWPSEEVLRSANVLYVDHYGVEGMIRAARIVRSAGGQVVADLERDTMPGFAELLGLVDHLIVSRAFATRLTGKTDPCEAVESLCVTPRAAVVVTDGAAGSWYRGVDRVVHHQPAFAVKVVDTTGCGDVFHGAYAALLAKGWSLSDRMIWATAAAAHKAMHTGGQRGCPTATQLRQFISGSSVI